MLEPILLYGIPAGSSTGLVAAFEWLGQPYRLCRVDMLGEMREPSYARVNGRHETPVLIDDGGRIITETMAIAARLERRDAERRISFDPSHPEADRMWQMIAYANTGFTAAFGPLWTALETEPPEPDYQTALRRLGRSEVLDRHDKLEAMLGDSPYLVGDRPTLADAVLLGVARWLDVHAVEDPGRWPKIDRWRKHLGLDPAVQFAFQIEEGQMPAGSGALVGHVALADVIEQFGA